MCLHYGQTLAKGKLLYIASLLHILYQGVLVFQWFFVLFVEFFLGNAYPPAAEKSPEFVQNSRIFGKTAHLAGFNAAAKGNAMPVEAVPKLIDCAQMFPAYAGARFLNSLDYLSFLV
jgi:hypothetical protein